MNERSTQICILCFSHRPLLMFFFLMVYACYILLHVFLHRSIQLNMKGHYINISIIVYM